MAKLHVTLEIDVEDLPLEERKELIALSVYFDEDAEVPDDEVPSLEEYSTEEGAFEIARVLEVQGDYTKELFAEFFAGSDVFATFTRTKVVDAKWL